jgi:hypothetical protein
MNTRNQAQIQSSSLQQIAFDGVDGMDANHAAMGMDANWKKLARDAVDRMDHRYEERNHKPI